MATPLIEIYNELVQENHIVEDQEQLSILVLLEEINQNLVSKKSFKNFFSKNSAKPKGLYLYGTMGTGKSMLMDIFYQNTVETQKKRIHFHNFMQEIHQSLHLLRQEKFSGDIIIETAQRIAREVKLLCFDELHVSEVTDAMILSRLFTELFRQGVVVVATSNRAPRDLYRQSYGKEHFDKFVALLTENMLIKEVQINQDYRRTKLLSWQKLYFYPLGEEADKFAENAFQELSQTHPPQEAHFKVHSRDFLLPHTYKNIAMESFNNLCAKEYWAAEYITLAQNFNYLILTNIPKMPPSFRNEAKRFVALIDQLYENKVILICTAEVRPEELYIEGDESFEFQRTISRLIEMQSEEYVNRYKDHE